MNKKKGSIKISIQIAGKGERLNAHKKVVELFIGEVPVGYGIYH